MYLSFFNLKRKPFELLPNPEFLYESCSHKRAARFLDYGIRSGAGLILLTGEPGSGKTILIRDLLTKRYEKVVVAQVTNTRVNFEELLAMISHDFGLHAAVGGKIALLLELNGFLRERVAEGGQAVVIIDEAQNLSADLLEELRMLTNLDGLQIVLVGQPELRATLSLPRLLQLRQRIGINCHLEAISREETAQYIVHRLRVAGDSQALEFPQQVIELIHSYSRGIPRLINIMCDFTMLACFAEELRSVSVEMLCDIAGDLDFENRYWGEVMAAGEETVKTSAASLAPAEASVSALADRIGAVEKEFSQHVPQALKEISETLLLFKEEVIPRIAKCEGMITRLSQMRSSAAECRGEQAGDEGRGSWQNDVAS